MSNLSEGIAGFGDCYLRAPTTLSELLVPPEGEDAYIDEIPLDPWGNPYAYEATAHRFEIRSAGEDFEWNTDDDICLSGESR